MRRKVTLACATFLFLIAIVATASIRPIPKAQASNPLQNAPRLDGYHIYFSESAGEASRFDRTMSGLSRLAGIFELLGANLYTLEWRTGIPADANLLVIAGPTTDLPPEQIAWLWDYVQNGGRLLLIADPLVAPTKAFPSGQGLFKLMWDDMGLRARADVVVKESDQTRSVVPPAPAPKKDEPTSTPAPAVDVPLLISSFITTNVNTTHPITTGLTSGLAFLGARSIEVDTAPRNSEVTALVYSDRDFYGESDFTTYLQTGWVQFNINTDTTRTALVLAAAMNDNVSGTRIVLIGDRDFATNGGGLQTSPSYSASFLYPDNVRFLVNAAAWLLGVGSISDQLTFPTPGPTETPTITPSPTPSPLPTASPTPAQ